jgi:hypothetical protein
MQVGGCGMMKDVGQLTFMAIGPMTKYAIKFNVYTSSVFIYPMLWVYYIKFD